MDALKKIKGLKVLGQKDLTEKAENVWCKEKKKLNKRDDDTKDKRRINTQNRLKIRLEVLTWTVFLPFKLFYSTFVRTPPHPDDDDIGDEYDDIADGVSNLLSFAPQVDEATVIKFCLA